MLGYIVRRLLLFPVVFLIFSVLIFAVVQAPPGDFLSSYLAVLASSGSEPDAAQVEVLRQTYGLDQPLSFQYVKWMGNVLQGNLGVSLEYGRPVKDLIAERLLLTMAMAFFAFVFTWAVAIPIGIFSATHQYSVFDYVFTILGYIGVATPNFMFALVLMWLAFSWFGVNVTGLFSAQFHDAPWSVARVFDMVKHLAIPVIILGTEGTARLSRILRANLLDELKKPYVVMARARGLPLWKVVLKYPVRMALNPLVSTIGWYVPVLFSGSLILATVMDMPTIGPLLLRALSNQDSFLASSILLIYSSLTMLGTMISDVLLAWLDPRIRMEVS